MFDVTTRGVQDADLGGVIAALAGQGYREPEIVHRPDGTTEHMAVRGQPPESVGLPSDWTLVGERTDARFRWPDYEESYDPYRIYESSVTGLGPVRIGLGFTERENKWGKDRRYVVAFLSAGRPGTPLVEFLETDDYAETNELLAVIRGLDGSRRMFGPSDSLPAIYKEGFRTEMYGQRVRAPGVWNKVVVIAREDDTSTMLNHAFWQAQRRGDLRGYQA